VLTDVIEPVTEAPQRPARDWRRIATPLIWLVVAAGWAGALLGTGTRLLDLALWVAVLLVGVLLPGFTLVRVARRGSAPLIEDLAWAAVAGCVVALAGWAVDVLVPVPPWVIGPLVAVLCLVHPQGRHRVLARPEPGWGFGATLGTAAAMLVTIAWTTRDFLAINPSDPGSAGHRYYPDVIYQVALVSASRSSYVLQYPLVDGDRYPYHFFSSAVAAHLSTGTGVDVFGMVLRLAPMTVLLAVVLLAAVVARRVAGREGAAPLAAALIGVVGPTVATVWSVDGGGVLAVFQTYWWASFTAAFGWLPTLAVAGCAVALLRPGDEHSARVPVWLLAPFLLLAAGAKSADLPVLLGGAGLAALVALLTRSWPVFRRAVLLGVAIAVVLGVSLLTMYAGSSSGLSYQPGAFFVGQAKNLFRGLTGTSGVAVLAAAALFCLPVLARMVGLVSFAVRRPKDPVGWFFAGVLLAGFVGLAAFNHPGVSELYFLIAAYPVAVVGSAAGIALLPKSKRGWSLLAGGAAIGAVVTVLIAVVVGKRSELQNWTSAHGHRPTGAEVSPLRQAAWLAGPAGVLVLVLLGLAVIATVVVIARRTLRGHAVVGLLTTGAILGTGLLSTGLLITATAATPSYSRSAQGPGSVLVTQDDLTAGRWLDAHAGRHDVLAVNRVCLERQPATGLPKTCTAKDFTMAATAQRTLYVGAWAYSSTTLDLSMRTHVRYAVAPFWDKPKLDRELAAFTAPTPQLLAGLYHEGVRWLVASAGGSAPDVGALDQLADRRVSLGTVTVWQLRER
jgi:hypothetical protein